MVKLEKLDGKQERAIVAAHEGHGLCMQHCELRCYSTFQGVHPDNSSENLKMSGNRKLEPRYRLQFLHLNQKMKYVYLKSSAHIRYKRPNREPAEESHAQTDSIPGIKGSFRRPEEPPELLSLDTK